MKTQASIVYPNISTAVCHFQILAGMILDSKTLRTVSDLITQNGITKKYVAELALGVVDDAALRQPGSELFRAPGRVIHMPFFDGRGIA